MTKELVASIASMDVPLPQQLRLVREAAPHAVGTVGLRAWGERHLGCSGPALDDWVSRAWWGLVAGEVLRAHLYDERRRPAALDLIDPADWSAVDEARQHGGVILVAAHIGPPKTAMNYLIDRGMPLLIWTNTTDMPDWLPAKAGAKFLDPLFADQRAVLLVKTALHLRDGGVLFGAPDWPSGTRTVSLHRFDVEWKFSLGIPALLRRLRLPAFLVMALWQGDRIRIVSTPIALPDDALGENEWYRLWLERYWEEVENVITSSPENLRFLRVAEQGALLREAGM